MKKYINKFVFLIILILLFGCNKTKEPNIDNNLENHDSIQEQIYELAIESGYQGTYQEWLNSIQGKDGLTIELQVTDGYIQWKYTTENDNSWRNLISLSSLIGIPGQNGKEVTFKVENGYIQWQYIGDATWNNLIELTILTGQTGNNGKEVTFKVENGYIQWQYIGDDIWNNLIELSSLVGPKGDDASNIEMKADGEYITWKYNHEENWNILVDLKTLVGPKGDDGENGKEIILRVENGYIQWQYTGDIDWNNLVELETLKGENGKDAENYGKTYVVCYDSNGGQFPENYSDVITIKYGETLDLPIPVKDGYIFLGWYTGLGVNDGQVNNATPITKNMSLVAMWEEKDKAIIEENLFYNYEEKEVYEIESKSFSSNNIIYKYLLGTLYNVPISYGEAKQMYGSSVQLSFEKGNIQETTVEHALEKASTIGYETFEQTEYNGGFHIGQFLDLGANKTFGNTEIKSTTTSEVISSAKSEANSISDGVTYTIENTKDTIGNYYRIVLVLDINYYAYVKYNALNDKMEIYITIEQSNNYKTTLEKSIDKNGNFSSIDVDFDKIFDLSKFSRSKLEQDGMFTEIMKNYNLNAMKEYEQSGKVWSEKFSNLFEIYAPFNAFYVPFNYNEIFGMNLSDIKKVGLYDSMSLMLKFDYKCNTLGGGDLRIFLSNDISFLNNDGTIIVDAFNNINEMYSVSISCPSDEVREEKRAKLTIDNLLLNNTTNEFYIIIYSESGMRASEFEISNVSIEGTIHTNEDLLDKNFAYERKEEKTSKGEDLFTNPSFDVYDKIDFSTLTADRFNLYKILGYTKIELSFTFVCSHSKYGNFLWGIYDQKGGNLFPNLEYSYENKYFDNTLDSITTTCTGTITIDMDTILNNSIYFIWQCGLFNTVNSGTTSTSNLQVQISFIK